MIESADPFLETAIDAGERVAIELQQRVDAPAIAHVAVSASIGLPEARGLDAVRSPVHDGDALREPKHLDRRIGERLADVECGDIGVAGGVHEADVTAPRELVRGVGSLRAGDGREQQRRQCECTGGGACGRAIHEHLE
jgi:hypothetical protein